MKLVHILSPAHAGGLERVVHALAIGQHRRHHDVVVIPVTDAWSPDHTFAVPLTRAGIAVAPLVLPRRAYMRQRTALKGLLRELAPDTLHSHGYHTDVIAGDVARRAGVATASTLHGFTRGGWRNRLYEHLDRRALRHFDAVAAVSRPIADELERSGVPGERIHVVPNGWSSIAPPLDRTAARRELGLDPHAFVLGWVGRMTREKGLDVFVDAISLLADIPAHVCIVGDGPEREREEARAAAAGIGDRIRWAGLVREAGRYFHAFDVLVLSSRTEGVPMVVLEAMAEGVPLVVTAVGGVPDVVSVQEGLVVPPERPDALSAAVRSIFANRAEATLRAAAAKSRLDREFSEDAWVRRYDQVYVAARRRANA